ncbi:hypothetical protein [Methylobacterium brachythecii]|uniref:Uncharacterized protein n=1 Tax=Methylobacterium brachythecii TaxID=1176177 RepID=A0A7W6F950_9HYPH|nr:hypothetical protein [Methylobacterium brachythecii]MBB3905120.1 hypothetical protein [Methylobacterium brachythecii]GLS44372.1 hypothetical protein GCM10007884_23600 [Methylobacterium brachythecii]
MSEVLPFRADPFATFRFTAAGAGVALPLPHGRGSQVRIRNRGTVDVSIEFGDKATVQAVIPAAGTPGSQGFAPGAVEFQTLQQNQRFVSFAVASGAPDVEITVGTGD